MQNFFKDSFKVIHVGLAIEQGIYVKMNKTDNCTVIDTLHRTLKIIRFEHDARTNRITSIKD